MKLKIICLTLTILICSCKSLKINQNSYENINILQAQNQEQIEIARIGSIPIIEGNKAHFTGDVHVNHTTPGGHPPNFSGGIVIFGPEARTVWHSHPKGQRVIIIEGVGWIQQWGYSKIEVRLGDVIWIPPNVKHWHGATATTGMSHFAFAETYEHSNVKNMEYVTDIQYNEM
jgi:quercetin dioxygenase-like cupin family protein